MEDITWTRIRRCLIPARKFYEWDREKTKAEYDRMPLIIERFIGKVHGGKNLN